ncbi:uncharacterized protein MKZ38_001811 [Zalerion maritima]|uniref:Uncharacterized protein n=1 Tax=Zalerion maritima TaxID=339359 RepID=A0AAD5RR20_9PEZI|nr:uncharacterized protein MKZ38_001811 [Zalerion maritima]
MASMVSSEVEWALSAPVFLYYILQIDFKGLLLLAFCLIFRNRSELLASYRLRSLTNPLAGNHDNIQHILGTTLGFVLVMLLTSAPTLYRFYRTLSRNECLPKWDGLAGPLIFPCKTIHARMFPQKHGFTYSYLMVGIPVEWEGNSAGMISAGMEKRPNFKKGLYNIDPGGYLERGSREIGLRGKLDNYLRTQNVEPSAYPYAYLVTAAKFMGYSSNPVSFWYLYSSDKTLSAMILEVNNTFDERRMYFLRNGDDYELEHADSNNTSSTQMRKKWPKDFHVSPFNSRKGSYSLVADDPFSPVKIAGKGPINGTITLNSSKGHAKLIARVFSDGPPVDPTSMNPLQKLKFLSCWWWVGLATIPRTAKEAAVLFFRKKMHVWYRPEPLRTTISAHASKEETQAERFFKIYLRHLVDTTLTSLVVKYSAAGLEKDSHEEMWSSKASDDGKPLKELVFKVLTPVFYTRFLHYAHNVEALCREHQLDCTIWLSDLTLIPELVMRPPRKCEVRDSYQDRKYLEFIRYLRTPPEPIERPLTSTSATKRPPADADIRQFRNSPMDAYFIGQEDDNLRAAYEYFTLQAMFRGHWVFGKLYMIYGNVVNTQLLVAWVLSAAMNPLFRAKCLS